ncbi:hypothetical protein HMPREF9320_1271 [Streptococcus pseudoporcinus SPIN 20026]|nr:hypothetical protein HMPREF9320_1271 [Streptococcus pseudoporcinus SPIN 20026]
MEYLSPSETYFVMITTIYKTSLFSGLLLIIHLKKATF